MFQISVLRALGLHLHQSWVMACHALHERRKTLGVAALQAKQKTRDIVPMRPNVLVVSPRDGERSVFTGINVQNAWMRFA